MKISLTYFDGAGRAEPIRLAFLLGNVDFEDTRVDAEGWAKMKAAPSFATALPLGQLPVLTVDGAAYAQSAAQLRFAGKLAQLYPADAVEQLKVDEVLETVLEVLNKAPQSVDDGKKKALREQYAATHMRRLLALVDRRIAAHESGWSAGAFSIADLAVFTTCNLISSGQFDHVGPDYCEQFAGVAGLCSRVAAIPKVWAYYNRLEGDAATYANPNPGGEKPLPPAQLRTWDDDAALGKPLPALDSLELYNATAGFAAAAGSGAPTLVVFWANYAEGDYQTVVAASSLKHRFPPLRIVGISSDASKDEVEKFVGKIGTSLPEANVPTLRVDFPLAYDPGRAVKAAFQKVAAMTSISPSTVFLADAAGVIVWKERFSASHLLEKGQLQEQIQRLLSGAPLVSNGPAPVKEEAADDSGDDGDLAEGEMACDDYDSDLGF